MELRMQKLQACEKELRKIYYLASLFSLTIENNSDLIIVGVAQAIVA